MFFFSKKSKGSERGAAIAAAGAIGLWQWYPDKGEFWFSSHARNLLQLEKSLPTLINVQKKIFTDDQAKFLQSFTDLHDDEFQW